MFDLEHSIAEWRRQMRAAGIRHSEALDELESHLREDIEQQVPSGINEARAFEIAVRRIGDAVELKKEFARGAVFTPAPSPKFLRYCCVGSAAFILLINTWTLLAYELSPTERSLGLSIVALFAFYIGALPYLNRTTLLGPRNVAVRKAVIMTCNLFVCLWGILALGSAVQLIHLPAGIMLNVFAWNLFAAMEATLLVLWCGRDGDSFEIPGWDTLTPMARESLEIAGAEALRFHHDFIGTEHLLLGVLGSESGIVLGILQRLGVSRENVRLEIDKIVGAGLKSSAAGVPRYTPRAKKAIKLAAKENGGAQVGVEHIFLGLLLEGDGVAALVLKNLGVDAAAARREILKESGSAE